MAAIKSNKPAKEDSEYSSANAEDEDKVEEESASKSDFGLDDETACGLAAILPLPPHLQINNGDNNDDEDDNKEEEEGACNVVKFKKMVIEHKRLKQKEKIMKLQHQKYELLLKIKDVEKNIEIEKLKLKYMK